MSASSGDASFPARLLVGLLAGLVAVAFRAVLAAGDTLRNALLVWAHHYPALRLALSPWLRRGQAHFWAYFSYAALRRKRRAAAFPIWKPYCIGIENSTGSAFCPSSSWAGHSRLAAAWRLGREGPTVQMGGAVGAAVSDWLNASTRDRLTLIAAGAGAGLAAAFNAPLPG